LLTYSQIFPCLHLFPCAGCGSLSLSIGFITVRPKRLMEESQTKDRHRTTIASGAAAHHRLRYPSTQESASGKGCHRRLDNGSEEMRRGIGIRKRRNSRRRQGRALFYLQRARCPSARLGRALSYLQRDRCPCSRLQSCLEEQIRLRSMHNGSRHKPLRSMRQQGKDSLLLVAMSRP
jgi:hypothetical protein